MPRIGLFTAALVGVLVPSILFMAPAKAAQPNPAAEAAVFIWHEINLLDELFQQCWEVDPPNVEAYVLLSTQYHQENTPLIHRINELVATESTRTGANYYGQVGTEQDEIEKTLRSLYKKDPKEFVYVCRGLPLLAERRISKFKPFHEKFPEKMHLIDSWH